MLERCRWETPYRTRVEAQVQEKLMLIEKWGLIGDLVVGVIGSFIGGYLFKVLHFSTYGTIGEIIMATIGAIVLLWIIRLFK